MATVAALGGGQLPNNANLSNGQTGNGASTNIVDSGAGSGPGLIKIVSTVGGSPTVTVAIECSLNGTDWFPAPYSDSATPTTTSVATFAITTATTSFKHLSPGFAYRYVRLLYSANVNVTLTVDIWFT